MSASAILKLAAAAALPVIASAIIYILNKKTAFSKLSYRAKQAIIGVVFGAIAIFGTEFGVEATDATMNVRDAAPLCAGLIFGAPAGIIAGLIGGVERWFATYWGAGIYTQLACSVSTAIAGFIGAALRKWMFDDKKPSWVYGLAAGIVAEVIHMLMLFFTNMSEVHRAFTIVEQCAGPMILANAVSVMLSVLTVGLLGREKLVSRYEIKKISQSFSRGLLVCVVVAFVATSVFTFVLQTQLSKSDADNLLKLNIDDVNSDINDASDLNLLNLTHTVARAIDSVDEDETQLVNRLAKAYDIAEINIIGESGHITASTNPDFVGYDMASGNQSSQFMRLLAGTDEYVQSYQPISYDKGVSRKYAGVTLKRGGFVQVGYNAKQFHEDIAAEVVGATRNRHVGEGGCIIIADETWNIVSDRNNYEGQNLYVTGIWIDKAEVPENTSFTALVYGESCYCMYMISEGYYIIAVMPETEAVFMRNVSVYVSVFMQIIVFAVMFTLIYFLIKKLIVENIQKINRSLAEITGGNLNVTVNVRSNEEFASLSDDINSTVHTLKRYIAEAAARIDKELEFAKTIQHSSLPALFPAHPSRDDFDIFADMITAKEVGGDFYDFYLLGENRLAFLIADVSGKGIPAAMFMMTAKTLIKSQAESGTDVSDVFTAANAKLCDNNEAGMFVTAWMGIIDLETGLVSFANAGHNPPLVKRGDGAYEYLKSRAGFVLAGMEGIKYRVNELALTPGDKIFLYTDGVTEATDLNDELYGEDRLINVLNANISADAQALCALVKSDVDAFVGEAPQFDDITMLCLEYRGKQA